ncbi:MAG: FAD-dependent monooxygenase [Methanotrichaceae archaeon]|nr:FAD-dependent monooxygenase [Methanotrichaceae archaeon]
MYDIIVVGAGPAGSSAARVAAKAGLDVLILEKETFPRYKPCGGALSERAISLLDFPLPENLCERTITGARVHYGDIVLERNKGYRLSTLVTRSRFDQFLLQKAQEIGAERVVQKVQEYKEKENHVEVLTKLEVFTSPLLASVGLGEEEAMKRGIAAIIHKRKTSDWYSNSRVGIKHSGYKILTDEQSGKIIGAHLLGYNADETINLFGPCNPGRHEAR